MSAIVTSHMETDFLPFLLDNGKLSQMLNLRDFLYVLDHLRDLLIVNVYGQKVQEGFRRCM